MRILPDRDGGLQKARPLFRKPDRAAALIRIGDGDFDEPRQLQAAQVSRQRRLIEPGALGERTLRVVGRGGDLRPSGRTG